MSRNREQARDGFLTQAGDKIENGFDPDITISSSLYTRTQRSLDGGRVAEIPRHCDQVPPEDRDVAGLGADPHGVAVVQDNVYFGG